LNDFNEFIQLIKKASVEAVKASKPTAVEYGKVTSTSPLKIQVDQKKTLTKAQLILTRNVTDYKVKMTVDHLTENRSGGSGEAAYASHNHGYKGKKEFIVHNALELGEKVILIQVQGGQKYVVVDRVIA